MSAWGKFILSHITIDSRGRFSNWSVIARAGEIWGVENVRTWCTGIAKVKA